MASERERVKRALTDQSDSDPALEVALSQGHELKHKYDVAVEQNRSKEQMRAMELGWFGRFFGGESKASTAAAFVVVCAVLIAFLGSLLAASLSGNTDFWSKQTERS